MLKKILDSIESYFVKIDDQIKEIKSYSFASKSYELLIRKIKKSIDKIYAHFTNSMSSIRENLKQNEIDDFKYNIDDYNRMAFYFKSFIIIDFIISLFKNFYSMNIHQGNFTLIEEISLNNDNLELTIFPYPHRIIKFNYGYKNISKILEFNNEKKENSKNKEFHSYFIPYFNQDDILMNCALGHEFGHFFEEKKEIAERIKKELIERKILVKEKIFDLLKKEKPHIIEEDWKQKIIYDKYMNPFFEKWREQCKNWLTELISDRIGLKVIGLPSFFSFIELLLLKNPYKYGSYDEYPPNWLRIKSMIGEIRTNIMDKINDLIIIDKKKKGNIEIGKFLNKRIDFIEEEFFKKNIPTLNQFENRTVTIINSDLVKSLIEEEVDKLINNGFIKDYLYSEQNLKDIVKLIELIDNYITPNEIINSKKKVSTPANLISIINAGWFYYLYLMKNHYELFVRDEEDYKRKAEVIQKLNNLILKAIELSRIHKYAQKILEN